jgi:ferritin
MLKKKIEAICNRQVHREAYSSHLYLAMASWAENNGYPGIASWLYVQSDEERLHMLKFIKYINERGGKAILPMLEKPPVEYHNVEDAFKEVLKHENFITESINEIVGAAFDEKDFTTYNWVQWFVSEQIQEEAAAQAIIDKLRLVGSNNMYLFDKDILGMRTPEANVTPAP